MNQGQIPEGLQRSIDIIKEAMSLRGTDYNTFEQLHDDYRRAIKERDINIQNKKNQRWSLSKRDTSDSHFSDSFL